MTIISKKVISKFVFTGNTEMPKSEDDSDDIENSPLVSRKPMRSARKAAGRRKHPLMSLNSPV